MKQLLKLTMVLALLSLSACAKNNTSHTSTKGTNMDKQTFGEKPIYKLRIEALNAKVIAKINGVEVYHNFSGTQAFALETVNDYITSGDNNISMTLSDDKLKPNVKGRIRLEVTSSRNGKRYTLTTLSYDLSIKDHTKEATPPGFYRFEEDKGMVADQHGKMVIGKIITQAETMYQTTKQDGIKATQTFSVPTPYPRWRFLDSQDIIDFDINYISMDAYKKLKNSPKIKALYAIDAKLRQALRDKKPQGVIDLFSERFEEDGIAFYDTPQNMKKILLDDFIEVVNNPNKELIEYKGDDLYFVIEENRKLAWLRPIEYYDKKTGLYKSYNIMFRLNKQGEWVITR